MAQQTKANNVVITLSIKVMLAQDAFLLESEGFMKFYGTPVAFQHLATDFVQFELSKSMTEC